LNNAFIQSLEWNSVTESLSHDHIAFKATTEAYVNHHTNEIEWWNPLALTVKENAMRVEITTLTKLKAWKVVPFTPDMNVLKSTWPFKSKRYPDGNIRKFKARFFCRGYQQVFGMHYFDTFAPVVSWTS